MPRGKRISVACPKCGENMRCVDTRVRASGAKYQSLKCSCGHKDSALDGVLGAAIGEGKGVVPGRVPKPKKQRPMRIVYQRVRGQMKKRVYGKKPQTVGEKLSAHIEIALNKGVTPTVKTLATKWDLHQEKDFFEKDFITTDELKDLL